MVPPMSEVLSEFVALLSLERIEENLFRGRSQDLLAYACDYHTRDGELVATTSQEGLIRRWPPKGAAKE